MATFNHIGGAEPSTLTFKAATVSMLRNSSVMHQELISLADPESSLSVARVSSAAPASSDAGLIVRQVGFVADSTVVSIAGPTSTAAPASNDTGVIVRVVGYSTIVTVAAMPAGSTTVTVAALPANSSQVEVRALPANSSNVAITGPTSTAAPASNDTGVVVRQVGFVAYSTTVSVAAMPAGSTTVTVSTFPANSSLVQLNVIAAGYLSSAVAAANSSALLVRIVGGVSSAVDNPVRAVLSSTSTDNPVVATIGTNLQSTAIPSSGSSGLVVRQVWDARSNAASTSAFATSTQFTISGSTVQQKYVTAYSLTSTDLTATVVRFMGGSTLAWCARMQTISSLITGVNLSAYPYIFKTDAASSLTLNISGSSRAGWTVAVSYFLAP